MTSSTTTGAGAATTGTAMTRSELIADLASLLPQLSEQDVELAINSMLDQMVNVLASGERIEIRGFGSLTLRYRPPRVGRNPRSGERVLVSEKYVTHFKPGNDLRERVNASVNKDNAK